MLMLMLELMLMLMLMLMLIGQVVVEVTFEINADGIVSVHAKDVETGKEQSITVTATSGLTEDEIDEMMVDASDFAVTRLVRENALSRTLDTFSSK